jgi:hypothetical protein
MQAASSSSSRAPLSFDLNAMLYKAKVDANGDATTQAYLEKILKDQTFQDDPHQYFRDWYGRKMGPDEYNVSIDVVFRFLCTNFPIPLNAESGTKEKKTSGVSTTQVTSFDLNARLQEAKTYAKDNNAIYEYIKEILEDDNFKIDPQQYVKEWLELIDQDGSGYRAPEHPALAFFIGRFYPGKL